MKKTIGMMVLAANLFQGISAAQASEAEGTIDTPHFKYTYKIESKCGGEPCSGSKSDNAIGMDSVGIEICNGTGQEIAIATATLLNREINEFSFRGWTRLQHNGCETFFGPALGTKDVAFFYRAETIAYSNGVKRTWSSKEYSYRIPSTAFSFEISKNKGRYPPGKKRGFRKLRLTPGVMDTLNLDLND